MAIVSSHRAFNQAALHGLLKKVRDTGSFAEYAVDQNNRTSR
jgi:hypothetical protein